MGVATAPPTCFARTRAEINRWCRPSCYVNVQAPAAGTKHSEGVRTEVAQFARCLNKKYQSQFTPELKAKALRLLRALISPRPRRGRPRDREISRAMTLLRRFKQKFPRAKSRENWDRVCLILIPEFRKMSKLKQNNARKDL